MWGPLQKEALVEQTLNVVELESISGQIVGLPGMYGLSGEQRKRLTIAVELAANPSILFMGAPSQHTSHITTPTFMREQFALSLPRKCTRLWSFGIAGLVSRGLVWE